jgi:prepilin-type processing-associated H-X9-DG protein
MRLPRVRVHTLTVDVDIVGVGEKSGGPTYAAITSRSYHPGGVNSLFGDGASMASHGGRLEAWAGARSSRPTRSDRP